MLTFTCSPDEIIVTVKPIFNEHSLESSVQSHVVLSVTLEKKYCCVHFVDEKSRSKEAKYLAEGFSENHIGQANAGCPPTELLTIALGKAVFNLPVR